MKEYNEILAEDKADLKGFKFRDFVMAFIITSVISVMFMSINCKSCFHNFEYFIRYYLIGMFIGLSIYFSAAFFNVWLSTKVDWLKHPWKSLLLVAVSNVILTFLIMLIVHGVVSFIQNGQIDWERLRRALSWESYLITLLITLFITTFFQAAAFLRIWKSSLLKAERLKQANLASQYETLNSQVNPHFLFNSLNVLSALVRKDPNKAEEFIQELANVYRNLLENRKEELVSLTQEKKSLMSYLKLLEMRFGERLKVDIQLEDSASEYVVPFALQMLMENTVKHNIASISDPLFVKLYKSKDRVVIENNKQVKLTDVESKGIGLKNIQDRYKILGDQEVLIEDNDDFYRVSIPIIKD